MGWRRARGARPRALAGLSGWGGDPGPPAALAGSDAGATPPADAPARDLAGPPDLATPALDAAALDLASGAPPGICSPDRYCWENPLPQGNHLFALWGADASHVLAVG